MNDMMTYYNLLAILPPYATLLEQATPNKVSILVEALHQVISGIRSNCTAEKQNTNGDCTSRGELTLIGSMSKNSIELA